MILARLGWGCGITFKQQHLMAIVNIGKSIMEFRKYFILLVFLSIPAMLHAQQAIPQAGVILPSPNASALLQYANVPVNLYTGVADISVPLYDFPGRKVNVPISLSYHASGIKVKDIASSVGLGWNLNAGGAITRIVRGSPDENGFFSGGGQKVQNDDFNFDYDYFLYIHGGGDTEPDIYYFNFLGKTGRFIMDPDGNPHLMPYQNMKIEPAIGQKGTGKWIITDMDGTQYIFGDSESNRETTIFKKYDESTGPNYNVHTSTFVSTWYLAKIIPANSNETVTFAFSQGEDILLTDITEKKVDFIYSECDDYDEGIPLTKRYISENLIESPKYLDRITTAQGEAVFGFEPGRKDLTGGQLLDNIKLYDNSGEIVTSYQFNYDYFNSGRSISLLYGLSTDEQEVDCTDEECYRLYLHSIEKSSNNEKIMHRSFEYNIDDYLPPRSSNLVDHWGYFMVHPSYDNYHPVLSSGIPELSSFTGIYNTVSLSGANKDAVGFPRTQLHILEKIIYPTGGFTEFKYEQNYSDRYVGGLRIKEIVGYDNMYGMENNRRTFHYSNGLGYSDPVYHYSYSDVDENEPTALSWANKLFGKCKIEFLVRNSESLVTLYDLNGSNIGYPTVVVERADGSKTVNNFTNLNSNPDEPPTMYDVIPDRGRIYTSNDINGIPFPSHGYRGWERGLLDNAIVYDGNGKKVKKIINNYDFDQFDRKVVKGLKLMANVFVEILDIDDGEVERPYYHAGAYNMVSRPFFLDYTTTEIYDQNDPANEKKITTRTDYEYDPVHLQVKEIINEDSEGNQLTTKLAYPADFDYSQDLDGQRQACYDQYEQSEAACYDLYCSELGISDENCITCLEDAATERDNCLGNVGSESGNPVIVQMKNKHIISPVIEKQQWISDNGIEKLLSANLTEHKIDGGYFLPAKSLSFRSNDGVTDFTSAYLSNDGELNPDSRYITENTFDNYGPYGNLLRQTSRDGTVTEYEWGYNYSLVTASTANAGTPYAQRTEYIHQPLVGLKSATDPNGFVTSYEYDDLNRLKLIRDHENNILKKYEYYISTHYLKVSKSTVLAPYSTGSELVSVTSNVDWSVTDDAEWISVDPMAGSGDGSFTITYAENNADDPRTGSVAIAGEGLIETITINQSTLLSSGLLTVNPDSLDFISSSQGNEISKTVTIESDSPWTSTISYLPKTITGWVGVPQSGDAGTGTVTVSVLTPSSDAEAVIKITNGNGASREITVSYRSSAFE